MDKLIPMIGMAFQWVFRELGAKAAKVEGTIGYDKIAGGQHSFRFRMAIPYWGTEIAHQDLHRAHYGIPGVAMVELEWD